MMSYDTFTFNNINRDHLYKHEMSSFVLSKSTVKPHDLYLVPSTKTEDDTSRMSLSRTPKKNNLALLACLVLTTVILIRRGGVRMSKTRLAEITAVIIGGLLSSSCCTIQVRSSLHATMTSPLINIYK